MSQKIIELFTDINYKPMLIPRRGKATRTTTLEKAMNKPLMVMPKWNLFIIDADMIEESHQYQLYRNYLFEQNIKHFEWSSGRPGHRHLVAAFASATQQQSAWEMIKRLKLDLRHHRMTRPPLTPHRAGFEVRLNEPYTYQDIIETLSVEQSEPWIRPDDFYEDESEELFEGPIKKSIRHSIMQLIVNGPDDQNEDRSRLITSVALSLINSNYSIEEGAKILSNPKNKISKHILESRRTPERQVDYARLFMRKALKYAKHNPSKSRATNEAERIRFELSKIEYLAIGLEWKGQKGNSELASLQAHLRAAKRAASFVYGLSLREQELTAELALMTCQRANQRLVEKGWLKRIKRATKEEANVWEVCVPTSLLPRLSSQHPCLNARDCTKLETGAPEGIFRAVLVGKQRGLGQSARRIYTHLSLGLSLTNDLIKCTGLSRVTVWRALERLKSHGMVNKSNKVTGRYPEILLEYARDKAKLIRARHAREREVWRESIVSYDIGRMKCCIR